MSIIVIVITIIIVVIVSVASGWLFGGLRLAPYFAPFSKISQQSKNIKNPSLVVHVGDRGRQNGHVLKIYLRLKLFLLFSLYSRYVGDNDETGDVTLKRVPNIGGLSEEDVQLCKEQ